MASSHERISPAEPRSHTAEGPDRDREHRSQPLAAARTRAGEAFTRRPLLTRVTDRYGWRPPSLVQGVIGVLAAVLLGAVAWWMLRPTAAPVESTLPLASSSSSAGAGTGAASGGAGSGSAAAASGTGNTAAAGATSTTVSPELVVQASGAVSRPGVYRLPAGARVDDLVHMAAGLRPDADGDRVNLASPLTDGARVWIPARGEQSPPEVVAGSGSPAPGAAGWGANGGAGGTGSTAAAGGAGSGATAAGQVVDLNTATAEQLDTLPGVGPATATAILAYRDEHGPFASIDDLLDVRGIGDAKLEQLRPLVRV